MPYIDQGRRNRLEGNGDGGPEVAGELNYMISRLLKNYWDSHHNYQGINDIVGALEGARMEFYRRIAVPYENQKIFENGDVY